MWLCSHFMITLNCYRLESFKTCVRKWRNGLALHYSLIFQKGRIYIMHSSCWGDSPWCVSAILKNVEEFLPNLSFLRAKTSLFIHLVLFVNRQTWQEPRKHQYKWCSQPYQSVNPKCSWRLALFNTQPANDKSSSNN